MDKPDIIELLLKGHRRGVRQAIDIAYRTNTCLIIEKNGKILAIKPKHKNIRTQRNHAKKNP
ncbi:MAG TPA: hypothetical protein VIJ46_04860 [Rhabdochlamydiaceae bacterium]